MNRALKVRSPSRINDERKMFCIFLEQTQIKQTMCLNMTRLVSIEADETSQSEESDLDE